MRVAFDARYVTGRGSGIGSYTLNLARALIEQDEGLELIVIRGPAGPRPLIDSPRAREILYPFPPNSPLTWFPLGALLRGLRFDLYHSPFAALPLGIVAPAVVTVHDLMWILDPRFISHSRALRVFGGLFLRAYLTGAVARAERILTVSNTTGEALRRHWPGRAGDVRLTPNGVDPAVFRAVDPTAAFRALGGILAPGTPFVLTVGDASPHKNHVNAVAAFGRAFADRPDYRMVLVRRFTRRDAGFERLLKTPALAGRVIVLPHVPAATLNALYNAARIYLHPSTHEGFGIPVLEAMAVGTPVVTSRSGALAEVAGHAALAVDPLDPAAIAAALVRLDRDPVERARLSASGKARVAQFTWRACGRATLSVYRELVPDAGAGAHCASGRGSSKV